jgi:hypothetical protein
LASGPERERGIQVVTQNLVWQSPAQAANWYHTLPAADRARAQEVFDRSGLSTEKRQELDKALAR